MATPFTPEVEGAEIEAPAGRARRAREGAERAKTSAFVSLIVNPLVAAPCAAEELP